MTSVMEKIRIRKAKKKLDSALLDLQRASNADESGQLGIMVSEAIAALDEARRNLAEVMYDLNMEDR